jgi:predicted PurR-regulated permease PerM
MKRESRYHRQFFFGILALAILSAAWLMRGYFSLIVVTIIYSIFVYPLYHFFLTKGKLPMTLSSIFTVVITFITIVVPLLVIATIIAQEALLLRQDIALMIESKDISLETSIDALNSVLLSIPGRPLQLTQSQVEETIKGIAGPSGTFIANQLVSFGASSAGFIADLFIFLILVFFTVPYLPVLKQYLLRLSPLPDAIDKLYVGRIIAMARAMVKGTFLVAIIQGVLAGLLLMSMGVGYIVILMLIMIISSIIPALGTNLVTLPIAAYFIFTGVYWKGIVIILVQVLVISSIDNILRPVFASGEGHLHPALLLLSVLAGIQVFGFMGIMYGPIILIFLKTSLDVYLSHYK